MNSRSRCITFVLLGGVATAASIVVDAKTCAKWMMRASQQRTQRWFRVSPDEARISAWTIEPGQESQQRVLDVASGREVDVDWSAEAAWYHGLWPPRWDARREVRANDGTTAVIVTWRSRGVERTFAIDRRHHVRTMEHAPGVVFTYADDPEALVVERHEMESGATRVIVRSAPTATATISPDGERVLVNPIGSWSRKRLPERRGVELLDARAGQRLDWIEAPWAIAWVGSGHRFVQTEVDGRLTVLDLEHGTRVSLETRSSTMAHVEVLSDGSLLRQDGADLLHYDGTSGDLLRRF